MTWSIIVHSGAGRISNEFEAEHRAGCRRAVEAATPLLEGGASAVDAACAAVRALEDDPAFNAGRGAALDEHGHPVLDAAIMRGADLGYGAVAAVAGVANPIDLARAVLEDGRHCLLVGAGALAFARRQGVALQDPARHVTPATRAAWEARRAAVLAGEDFAPTADWKPVAGGTVGACVRDAQGHLAAATSTGGLLYRYEGRVGDSPIAGAGTYAADSLGAVSATGHGETMMKTVFAYATLRALEGVEDAEGVLKQALADAERAAGGTGGVIVVRPDGTVAHARNTRGMGVAWARRGLDVQTGF